MAALDPAQLLCHNKNEEASDLKQRWMRSMGGGLTGAPRPRNVNWEDCFNKVLICADAGRRLASEATQRGGQLTVRYCQKT